MKLRSPWLLRLAAFLGAWLIRCWMGTVHKRVASLEEAIHPRDPRKQCCIYAFWHETMLFPAVMRYPTTVLISESADGELIAQACGFLGFSVVRGSTTRGGGAALIGLQRLSRDSHIAFTPDGPRGPRRRVQPGLIYLASRTGLPIVALGVGYADAWRARSWDRFAIPKPGSIAAGVFTAPIYVPARLDRAGLAHYLRLVEEQLTDATTAAERWAQGGPRPTATTWRAERERKASA